MNLTWICVLVSVLACAKTLPEEEFSRFITLTKFDYEEYCTKNADSEWAFINNPTNQTRQAWEIAASEYATYKIKQVNETSAVTIEKFHDNSLAYAYNIVIKPGDALLQTEDFHKLVSFSTQAESSRLKGFYLTDGTQKHFRQDVERQLSRSGKSEEKFSCWSEWHKTLTFEAENFSEILQLAEKAADANGENNVGKYWEMLSGVEDGYEKAKNEWSKIVSLHDKLQKFVKQRLAKKYGQTEDTLAAHLLGSLRGFDWTPLAMDVISYSDVVYDIRKNMWEKEIVGEKLYAEASKMGNIILKQMPRQNFWNESEFRGQCPSHLLNLCQSGKMRVSTCSDASIGNFISAHKNVGKILVNQISHDTEPILGIANRYSALEESVAEFFGILSVSHAWLNARGLINNDTDIEEIRIVSMMITALDILPRMAYYLAADTWRLDALRNSNLKPADLQSSWWKNRLEYEGINSNLPNLPTFLDDDYITSNKPYLSKFLGTILGFQIYEYIMESTEIRYETLLPTSGQAHHRLQKMIHQGFENNWTEVINKYMEISEISSDSLIQYFSTLEDYIDENEELLENFLAPEERERELDTLEDIYRKKLREPSTTTTTTTTIKPIRYKPRPSITDSPKSSILSKNQSNEEEISSEKKTKENSLQTEIVESTESEDTNEKSKATNKAVWAVGSVLVATIIICIIAIVGRRRCRKAPKNRRYV